MARVRFPDGTTVEAVGIAHRCPDKADGTGYQFGVNFLILLDGLLNFLVSPAPIHGDEA
jgi:hypothetical protein